MEISRYVFVLSCLPVSALILEHNGNKQQAAQMLGLAYARMPYTAWLEKWPLLNRLRARLEAELGADVYAAACQRGAQLDLLTTVRDLLSESGEAASVPTANGLTERELEILGLTAQGLSNREIAEKLVFQSVRSSGISTRFTASSMSAAAPRPSPAPGNCACSREQPDSNSNL
jgi:hypothetical protein